MRFHRAEWWERDGAARAGAHNQVPAPPAGPVMKRSCAGDMRAGATGAGTVPVMSSPWRTVAAVLTPLLAAATMFAIVVVPELNDEPAPVRLLACSSPEEFEPQGVEGVLREDCLTEVLTDAVAGGEIRDVVAVMAEFEARQMGLCHRAAHRAGGAVWPGDGRWIEKIADVNFKVCSSGLLHGFVDQVVGKGFTDREWAELTAWCDGQFVAQAGVACGDAVGHVAWTDTEDHARAREICSMFATPLWKAECAEGVVMQQYSPASSSKPHRPLPADPVTVCEIHPAGGSFDAVRAGCIRGVAYAAVQQETFDLNTPKLLDEVDRVVGVCWLFEEQYQALCVDRSYDMVRSRFFDTQYVEATDLLCDPADRYYQTCIDRMLRFVPAEQLGGYAKKITPPGELDVAFTRAFMRE